jgi:ferredoxin-like protein FixX
LKNNDVSATSLGAYDEAVNNSSITSELYARRNMRLAFKDGFYLGGIKSVLMTLTNGVFPGGRIDVEPDSVEARTFGSGTPFTPDDTLTFSKLDAVFKAGNATRDDIPSHLIVGRDVPAEVAEFYQHVCPAGVYERDGDKLMVNAPNCGDCKAPDVIGPRWLPREAGSGPRYRRM